MLYQNNESIKGNGTVRFFANHIILLVSMLIYLVGCIYVYEFYIDDTFISLRYAKNLVTYGSLAFNPGEPAVEGYTNFLLILIEALFLKLGVQNVLLSPKS